MVGSVTLGFFHLGIGAREDRHFGAQCLGQFDPHMAQATHTNHAYFMTFAYTVMLQRRVGGDTGAQDGGC